MYSGDHVDIRICPTCGNTLTPPSDGGCVVCWHGAERGLMEWDESAGGHWVHNDCLDLVGVDTVHEYVQS